MGENLFEVVEAVRHPSGEAAELYGLAVGRGGMACCPFHDDRHPSHEAERGTTSTALAAGATGDVIDFTARLYDLSPKEAAEKLAQDFGLAYDSKAPIRRNHVRQKSEAQLQGKKIGNTPGAFWRTTTPPAPKMGDRLFPQDAGRGPAPALFGGCSEKRVHGLSGLYPDQQTRKIRVCRRISRDYTALLLIS